MKEFTKLDRESKKKHYNENPDEVRVVNLVQAKAYILNGLQPLRVEADDRLVFVFDREASHELWLKWKAREI